MHIYPAIDLLDGRVVRLYEGDYERVTDYGDQALAQARAWREMGAEWLHVVDLDAARGTSDNRAIIAELVRESGLRVQVGGGIRSLEQIEALIELGVARLIIGTYAVREPEGIREALRRWPDALAIACDSRDEVIRIAGWTESGTVGLEDFALAMREAGARTLVFTEISRDGTYAGPAIARAVRLQRSTGLEVILAAGVRDLDDVAAAERAGLDGLIAGRALHDGRLDLAAACALLARPEQLRAEETARSRAAAAQLWGRLRHNPQGLVPVIVVDGGEDEVLMQAYMNEAALAETLATGWMSYYSRSRGELWTKGLTAVWCAPLDLRVDCDADCLLAVVDAAGPACHTGEQNCFFRDWTELLEA